MTPRRCLLAALLLLVPLAACADDAPDRAAMSSADDQTANATVRIERSRFSDPEITVAAGTTVVFVNDDPFAHTVTVVDDLPVRFDSGELAEGQAFEVTFDRPGTYSYFCEIHPTMRAVVVVT